MRLVYASTVALAAALLMPAVHAQDADRVVAGGGITVPGWMGRIDEAAAKKGLTISSSKFAREGDALHLTIGPAATYWNPANVAKGDFTVKGTFREGKTTADHPHPAGIFIGGSKLGTDEQTYMYCVAYGSGEFLVRRFNGLTVTTVARRQAHAAVHKTGPDGSTTQEIGWTVRGGRAECIINGASVIGFDQAEIVGPGKLESTDGVYGIRVSHNMDIVFTGFGLTK
jgi:opacity protein-like surface antigen